MAMHDDKQDRMLDRNLAEIGRQIELPDEPTEAQVKRWRSPSATPMAPSRRGIRFMRNHKMFTLVGASSALAACLAVAVVFMGPWGRTEVKAAVIFQSFREAVSNAFSLRIENVKHDGVSVNGRALVILSDEESDGSPPVPPLEDPRLEAAFVELHVQMDDDHPEAPGLDFEAAVSMRPDREWAFVKAREIPMNMWTQHPGLAIVGTMARGGILVELDGAMERHRGQGAMQTHLNFGQADPDQTAGEEGTPESGSETRLEIGFHLGGGDAETQPQQEGQNAEEGNSHWQRLHGGLHARIVGGQSSAEHHEAMLQHAADAHGVSTETVRENIQAVHDMFHGRMTPEQMAAVVSWIEASAGQVSVEHLGDGEHLLTAREFDLDELPLGEHDRAQFSGVVLEISYREDTGIQSAVVRNVGEANGVIRFERSHATAGDPMFDRQRLLDDGTVRVLNLSRLIGTASPEEPDDEASE